MFLWEAINSLQLSVIPLPIIISLIIGGIYAYIQLSGSYTTESIIKNGPVSPEALQALADHKYKCSEYTVVDNLMNHWWNWASNYVPTTLAPNVITLLGWLAYMPSVFAIMYYSPNLTEELPSWVYYMGCLSVFLYQTFDALDGKQARRLQASSPLGQLFDHGIDAMACTPVLILISAAVGLDSYYSILLLSIFQLSFFAAQWLEKYLHTLVTSIGGIGVTEGQLLAMTVLALTGTYGRQIWDKQLNDVFSLEIFSLETLLPVHVTAMKSLLVKGAENVAMKTTSTCLRGAYDTFASITNEVMVYNFMSITFRVIIYIVAASGSVALTCDALYRVFILTKKDGYKAVLNAYAEMVAPVVLIITTFTWYHYSAVAESTNTHASFFYNTIVSIYVSGFIFTHITCQMIVSTMTKNKYHWYNQPVFIPYILLAVFEYLAIEHTQCLIAYGVNIVNMRQILYTIAVVSAVFAQLNWGARASQQVANFLNIYVLTLGKRSN